MKQVVIVLVIIFCSTILIGELIPDKYEYQETLQYQVHNGDTLWSIAEQFSSNEHHDIRQVIYMIRDINSCSANIYPGQQLNIPVFKVLE